MCCPSHESMVQSLRGQEDRRARVQDSYLLATKAREVSEARSKGMDHSLIGKPSGKPSLCVGMLIGLMLGLSLLLFVACDDQDSAKGGAGQEHKKGTSGGPASTDGLIVFRRYLDLDLTRSAIFTMYPNGTHIRQITHPPRAGATTILRGPPMGPRSPSNAGVTRASSDAPRIARGAGSWSSTSTPALRARSHTAYPMWDGLRRTRLHHPLLIAWETTNPPSQPTVSQ
jgi:hypothetical protein